MVGNACNRGLNDWQLDVNQVHMSENEHCVTLNLTKQYGLLVMRHSIEKMCRPQQTILNARNTGSACRHIYQTMISTVSISLSHTIGSMRMHHKDGTPWFLLADLFQNRYGRLPRFWLDRFVLIRVTLTILL